MTEPATTATRVKKKREDPKVYALGHAHLDPLACGSEISYKLCGFYYNLEGTVILSDCNRKIEWSFNNSNDSVDKIDAVIDVLTQFRRDLVKAQKQYKKDFPKNKNEDE